MSNIKESTHILNKFQLHSKVALVTGGAGLLGAEFCNTLAQAGAKVVIADLHTRAAEDIADALIQKGNEALAVGVDISDPVSVNQMVATCLDVFKRLDILVNSAALDPKFDPQHIMQPADEDQAQNLTLTFENYPLDVWNAALNVNLTGVFLCCQAAVRPMLSQGNGVIVNISSIYGLVGPDQRIYQRIGETHQYKPVYYTVTKAGLLGLTRYLATYYAGKNIRVNALTPGGVYNQHDSEFLNAYSAKTVLGRMAEKDEMNGALLFLVSDASAYMTGANLIVDGGWTAW